MSGPIQAEADEMRPLADEEKETIRLFLNARLRTCPSCGNREWKVHDRAAGMLRVEHPRTAGEQPRVGHELLPLVVVHCQRCQLLLTYSLLGILGAPK